MAGSSGEQTQKKVVDPRLYPHRPLEEREAGTRSLPPAVIPPRPKLRERIANSVSSWMRRRLQRRVEREWQEYKQPPEVSVGPFFRSRRHSRGDTQVYRSLVQIHFHPRNRESR